ncbi:MAG TPA: hypothetical protein VMF62_13420 [Acetobacteraceae bacterium]|nr:hypothetical protein [Acetobacteraceae bacterium]
MPDAAPRWLDRDAAAAYVSVPPHHLPRLVRAGKIPPPSLHLGPRSPRYDRLALDAALGVSAASADHERAIQEAINEVSKRGRARRSAPAR